MALLSPSRQRSADVLPLPDENITGHLGRVEWMTRHLQKGSPVLEVGCGTGYRVTYVLKSWGYDVLGIDIDGDSVDYGKRLLAPAGLADLIQLCDVRDVDGEFDAAILSEVLEHLSDADGLELLAAVRDKLRPNGTLIVTVPNGYGWYEAEAFLWKKTGVGLLLERTKIASVIRRIKQLFVSGQATEPIATSLSTSPHVQRFTLDSITQRLEAAGFDVVDHTGSVLFCGPFTDMFFTGARSVQKINQRLGRRFPRAAAGFYLAARSTQR